MPLDIEIDVRSEGEGGGCSELKSTVVITNDNRLFLAANCIITIRILLTREQYVSTSSKIHQARCFCTDCLASQLLL